LKRLALVGVFAAFMVPGAASAHHSLASFNRSVSETLHGTVMSFSWSNPHVRLIVAVEHDGAMQQWSFEGGSVNRLANAGFNRNIVAAGDKVTVTYNPKRDGSNAGFLVGIVSASGRKYDAQRNRGPTRGGAEEG
jgi:uncharacterized protein DUF6152